MKPEIMKNCLLTALAMTGLGLALHLGAATPSREKTITGEGARAKCILKEPGVTQCQLTITTEEKGKKVTYYLVNNEVSRRFAKPVCKERKKMKATGELKIVDGKLVRD